MNNDFKITTPNPPTPEQLEALWENGGCEAFANLIVGHIQRGLEKGTWHVVDGKARPVEKLPFRDIILTPATITEEMPR